MPVRSSMAAIIAETRLLINDTSGAQVFGDQQIQDHLDDIRDEVRYEMLMQAPTIVNLSGSPSGTASFIYADDFSQWHWWETDAVLQDGKFTVLTPLASDYLVGHWQFDSLTPFTTGTAPGQYPPVFITGKSYDVNLAASNLWRIRAGMLATAYDFTADGQTFHRSQQMAMCLKMADYYACKARLRSIQLRRDDVAGITDTSVETVPLFNTNRSLIGD